MPANGFDSVLISARPQFPSGTFALIDWENGRMEFSIGTNHHGTGISKAEPDSMEHGVIPF